MFFSINTNNGIAIYQQIVRQVKFAVAEGSLQPGQLLPGGRSLSVELAINPNTVVKAYQQLQSEGVLESMRGRGMMVCQGAAKFCRQERKAIISDGLKTVLSEALHAGLSPEEIEDLVGKQLKKLGPKINTVAAESPSESNG